MAATYITRDGDTADRIAWRHYGTLDGRTAEIVLAANPGLADYGARLPAALTITLPDIERPAMQEGVRLWD